MNISRNSTTIKLSFHRHPFVHRAAMRRVRGRRVSIRERLARAIEPVSHHSHIGIKRHNELKTPFSSAKSGRVFVTVSAVTKCAP